MKIAFYFTSFKNHSVQYLSLEVLKFNSSQVVFAVKKIQ